MWNNDRRELETPNRQYPKAKIGSTRLKIEGHRPIVLHNVQYSVLLDFITEISYYNLGCHTLIALNVYIRFNCN